MQCPAPSGPGSGFMLRYTGDNVRCGVLLGQHLEQKGIQTKKSWPVHQSVQFFEVEVRGVRKVTTGIELACGSQVFIAMLLFCSSMSALPIIVSQKSPIVGLFTHEQGT
jgi:hypothetical protein